MSVRVGDWMVWWPPWHTTPREGVYRVERLDLSAADRTRTRAYLAGLGWVLTIDVRLATPEDVAAAQLASGVGASL